MYSANRDGDVLELVLYDDIGEGFFGGITSGQVMKDVTDNIDAAEISVRINSAGGDVFEGIAIFNALRRFGKVTAHIDALAASIASVSAMAGDEIHIAPTAMMMIHNPWTIAAGDAREFRRTAELLDQVQGNLVGAYTEKTGVPDSVIQDAMDAETWYTAQEAVGAGLADHVAESEMSVAAAIFDPKRFRNTPERFQSQTPPKQPVEAVWEREARRRKLQLLTRRSGPA